MTPIFLILGLVLDLLVETSFASFEQLTYRIVSCESSDDCQLEYCLDDYESYIHCFDIDATGEDAFPYIEHMCSNSSFDYNCGYDDLVFRVETAEMWYKYQETFPLLELCPVCSCSTSDEFEYYTEDVGTAKICTFCQCVGYETSTGTELGQSCETISTAYVGTDDYDSFECPPTGIPSNSNDTLETSCEYDGIEYYLYESFMAESEGLCNTYCICSLGGEVVCEPISTLLDTADLTSDLYVEYQKFCGWSSDLCPGSDFVYYKADSWGCHINFCPRCPCDTIDFETDIAYTSISVVHEALVEENGCAVECVCSNDSRYSEMGYDCRSWRGVAETTVLDIECTGLQCSTGLGGRVANCMTSTQQTYCSRSIYTEFGFDSFASSQQKLVSKSFEVAGCMDSYMCLVGGSEDNSCVSYDVSFTSYLKNCNDKGTYTQDVQFTDYLQCCQGGDSCNEESSISAETCTRSSGDLGTMMSALYACQTSQDLAETIGIDTFCGKEWSESITLCQYVESYIKLEGGCYCDALGSIYSSQSSVTQLAMEEFMDNKILEIEHLISTFACDVTALSCDLENAELVVTYTDYTASFAVVVANFNADDYAESDFEDYISDVIAVGAGSIELSDVSVSEDQVSATVTVTFASENDAESFSTAVQSDTYDFGEGVSVSVVEINDGTAEEPTLTQEGSASTSAPGATNGEDAVDDRNDAAWSKKGGFLMGFIGCTSLYTTILLA